MLIKSSKKVATIFCCEKCDYITSRKYNMEKHVLTPKHTHALNANGMLTKSSKKVVNCFVCKCGVEYKHMSSLCRHQQKCNFSAENETTDIIATPLIDVSNNALASEPLIMELLKQNGEFKDLIREQNNHIIELMSKGIGNTTISNKTKNKFNLNFFLNEKCKDAMNIMDFVNTMQLQLADLERVGELGFVKGISHIVVNKLKDLDVCKRPIHCSDVKRETLYIKDQDMWEKENPRNEKLTKMVKHVAHKNLKQLTEWQKENPEYTNSESLKSEEYLKIVGESMGGSTTEEDATYCNKIIKNIAKEVVIEYV